MANEHTTLTSLFKDTANAIRAVMGLSDANTIVADKFPDKIRLLGNSKATQWDTKYEKILTPTLTNTTAAITVKALCYYDGYWYGAGNDSAGDLYKLCGTTASALTAYKIASSRAYPVKGIACDGTYVWICNSSGAYSGRKMLYQTVDRYRASSGEYNYYTFSTMPSLVFNEACSVNDASLGPCVFAAGVSDGKGVVSSFPTNLQNSKYYGFAAVPEFVSCCNWNETATFIATNGHICKHIGNNTYSGQTFACLQDAKMVRAMNGNLVIACVKTNGTYLYWFRSEDTTDGSYNPLGFKITDEVLTIIGMAYAGGLYTVVGVNSSGVTKVWQSTDLNDHGIYGQVVTLTSGYTPRVMATDGTNICILADNGTKVQKALAKIE